MEITQLAVALFQGKKLLKIAEDLQSLSRLNIFLKIFLLNLKKVAEKNKIIKHQNKE